MTYYDTTNVSAEQRVHYAKICQSQENVILALFRPQSMLTASQVWEMGFDKDRVPLTSIRRGISNLRKAGKLRKVNATRKGKYNRPEHYWTLCDG